MGVFGGRSITARSRVRPASGRANCVVRDCWVVCTSVRSDLPSWSAFSRVSVRPRTGPCPILAAPRRRRRSRPSPTVETCAASPRKAGKPVPLAGGPAPGGKCAPPAARSGRGELRVVHSSCRSSDVTSFPGAGRRIGGPAPGVLRARVPRLAACVPPAARRDRGETSTPRAARASRPPSPAPADGGSAPGGTCVCPHLPSRHRGEPRPPRAARATPRRPSLPGRPTEGPHLAAQVCAPSCESPSLRAEHA